MTQPGHDSTQLVGWREWVTLPELGIDAVKAKIDTGARTSALHTFSLETANHKGVRTARFGVHPNQHDHDTQVWCESPVVDERTVRDSGGHHERRIVVATLLRMGSLERTIELTLTARDSMLFRMLIGRTALAGWHVDPTLSFVTSKS